MQLVVPATGKAGIGAQAAIRVHCIPLLAWGGMCQRLIGVMASSVFVLQAV